MHVNCNSTREKLASYYVPYTVIRFFSKYFRTQKTYKNILREYSFTPKISSSDVDTSATTHHHFTNCCCPYSLYTWQPLTQQAISFSTAISSARGAISSISAHHTRLVKLFSFCAKIILRKYFFGENLLDEIKANYVRLNFWNSTNSKLKKFFAKCGMHTLHMKRQLI